MVKKTKTVKNETLSHAEEFMMCAAIRYCVGRQTGASQEQAGYIASKYYDKLSDERREFTAKDVRDCILERLMWKSFNFSYDGTVSSQKRLPFEDFMTFISTLQNPGEDLLSITNIDVYCESYSDDAEKKFRVTTTEPNVRSYLSEYEIECLLPWQRFAALFDKRRYKLLKVKYDGVESDVICVETYVHETEKIEGKEDLYRIVPWKYKKVYVNIETLKSGNMENCPYYDEQYIVSVD
jgi:hypothetical protein